MRLKTFTLQTFIASICTLSLQASAGLMLETYSSGQATPDVIGGYNMTDFNVTNEAGGSTSSIASPLGGTVNFENINGDPLALDRRLADNTLWWNNPEATNNDIFTTDVSWVEVILPENTRAFSFNVGANFTGYGWLVGYNNNLQQIPYTTFDVGSNNTPGFGVYADNSDGQCGEITSIVIDPRAWGLGNLSINQDECVASVPEPGILSLLAVGLAALGFSRKRYAA